MSAHRSCTRPSASTTAAQTWNACPRPAPAWTCSSCRSSATSTWWRTSCCTPSSRLPGSSWAEGGTGRRLLLTLHPWTLSRSNGRKKAWDREKETRTGKENDALTCLIYCVFVCVCVCVCVCQVKGWGGKITHRLKGKGWSAGRKPFFFFFFFFFLNPRCF